MEEVCNKLKLDYELVEAVDGRALSERPGSSIAVVSGAGKAMSSASPSGTRRRPSGFSNLKVRNYRACWMEEDKQQHQLLRMAEHRLLSSELTQSGHELWGAVGCSLSHQEVLRRIIADPALEWALVLEDDATLAATPAEIQEIFDEGLRDISRQCPDWALVYLGGHVLNTERRKSGAEDLRLNGKVLSSLKVYQTHAFVIRRCLAPMILDLLEKGFAADAAFVSWSRRESNRSRTFLFCPQLLVQPGGQQRWKDSDIFVEGEFFKQETAKLDGSDYRFTAARSKRPSSLRGIMRGSAKQLADDVKPCMRDNNKAIAITGQLPHEKLGKHDTLAKDAFRKVHCIFMEDHLSYFGISAALRAELLSILPFALGLPEPGDAGVSEILPGEGKLGCPAKIDIAAVALIRAALAKTATGFNTAASEAKASLTMVLACKGLDWMQHVAEEASSLENNGSDHQKLTSNEKLRFQTFVQCIHDYAEGVEPKNELFEIAAGFFAAGRPKKAGICCIPPAPDELLAVDSAVLDEQSPTMPEALPILSLADTAFAYNSRRDDVIDAIRALDACVGKASAARLTSTAEPTDCNTNYKAEQAVKCDQRRVRKRRSRNADRWSSQNVEQCRRSSRIADRQNFSDDETPRRERQQFDPQWPGACVYASDDDSRRLEGSCESTLERPIVEPDAPVKRSLSSMLAEVSKHAQRIDEDAAVDNTGCKLPRRRESDAVAGDARTGVTGQDGMDTGALVHEMAHPQSAADIDPSSMTSTEEEQWKKKHWAQQVWCHDCDGGSICKIGWTHQNQASHICCSLKEVEKVDDGIREFLFAEHGDKAAHRAQVSTINALHPSAPVKRSLNSMLAEASKHARHAEPTTARAQVSTINAVTAEVNHPAIIRNLSS
jgi:hypothetical protein